MNKILGLLTIFLFTTISVFSADMRFIQVDGVLLNSNNTKSFEDLIDKINKEKRLQNIAISFYWIGEIGIVKSFLLYLNYNS